MNRQFLSETRVRGATLILLALSMGCGAVTESVRARHNVRVNFTSAASGGAAFPRPYVSVVDTVILTATLRSSGQTVARRTRLARGDSIAEFTLPLAPGDWALDARVVSNNGSQLYVGSTVASVADSDVTADIVVRPVAPVLLATPDSTTEVRSGDGVYTSVTLYNRGVDTLAWSVPDTVPMESRAQCGAAGCVRLSVKGGVLSPTQPYIVTFIRNADTAFKSPITFLVKSRVGTLPVVLRPF